MKRRFLSLSVIITLFAFVYMPCSSQEYSFSYTEYYLIGRFNQPTESKYSPDWKLIEKQNVNDIIPKPLDGFPDISTNETSNEQEWFALAYTFLKGFILEPHNYGDYAENDEDIYPFIITYGLLGNGNYTGTLYGTRFEMYNKLFNYFTIKENAKKLLSQIMPAAKWAIGCMSESTRSAYKTVLSETIKYIGDLGRPEFLEREIEFCKRQSEFTYKNSKGEVDVFRKAKAFVFRRYIDFLARDWTEEQKEDFYNQTYYTPKPVWGMDLKDIKEHCNTVLKWF